MPSRFDPKKLVPDKRRRHYLHVLESDLDRRLARGEPLAEALRRARATASRTINKFRARRAAGRVVCKPDRRMKRGQQKVRCRVDRGPRLVRSGGSRRGWYPGKRGVREVYLCFKHRRKFRTKAAWLAHHRAHAG